VMLCHPLVLLEHGPQAGLGLRAMQQADCDGLDYPEARA
jgi:hypothetical protein